jgi:hypothetical protein
MTPKTDPMIIPSSWPKGWVPPVKERPQNTLRMALGYLAGSLAAIPVLSWISIPNIPLEQKIMAYVLLCICTAPVILHFSKREPGLPIFPVICLVYGVSYALPIFIGEPVINLVTLSYEHLPVADCNRAARLAVVGVLSMQFGFLMFRYSVLSLLVPHLRLELDPQKAISKISLLGMGGVVALWLFLSGRVAFSSGFTSIATLISQLPTLCGAYLYWAYLRGEVKGRWIAVMVVILVVDVGVGFTSGSVRNVIGPMISVAAVYWMVRRRVNWKYAICGIFIFLTLQTVKSQYRVLVWTKGQAKNDIVGQLVIMKRLMGAGAQQMLHRHQTRTHEVVRASVSRTDLIHLFAHAIHMTPRFVPFQHGDTYSYLLLAWVPRALWANKPTAQAANQFFGVTYNLQTAESVAITSIGLPQLVEAFINFGDLGVVFIMMLMGIFYAVLDRMFNHSEAGGGATAIYSTLLMNFVNIETSTAAIFGALPQTVLIFYLILRSLRARRAHVL